MLKKPACPVIAIEEHYWDKELSDTYAGIGRATQRQDQVDRLLDLGDVRIREMDEAGIDMQVLSHGSPSTQDLTGPGELLADGRQTETNRAKWRQSLK